MKAPDRPSIVHKKILSIEEKKNLNKEITVRGGYIMDSIVTDQRAFYDLRAEIYDEQNETPARAQRREVFNNFYREKLKDLLPHSLAYLDFGCATGTYTNQFLDVVERRSSIQEGYAVDISEEMTKRAVRTLPTFKVIRGGVEQINLKNKLDLVTSFFHVLCHLSDAELEAFFQNAARALKPSGILCFDVIKRFDIGEHGYSEEHARRGQKYLVYHSAKKDGSKVTGLDGEPVIGTDRMFIKEEIENFAKRSNLEVVEIKEIYVDSPEAGNLREYAVILRKA